MKPTKLFWAVAVIAVLWNTIGVVQYLLQVTMPEDALQALAPDMRAYFEQVPVWVTGAFAVAVWCGFIGSIALLLRKAWAIPLFSVSLAGVLVQLFYNVVMQTALALSPALLAGPVVILLIAVALLLASRSWKAQGTLS